MNYLKQNLWAGGNPMDGRPRLKEVFLGPRKARDTKTGQLRIVQPLGIIIFANRF
jgi:hypothetical protein